MNRILNFLRQKKVHVVQIRGDINPNMTQKIHKSLKNFKGDQSKCLALIINSSGGSPAQAYLIMRRLQAIKEKYRIPIYTFAEDNCISAAFLLHQLGDKRFCDETSIMGGVGTIIQQFKAPRLLSRIGVDVTHFSTSDQQSQQYILQRPSFNKIMDPLVESGDNTKFLSDFIVMKDTKFKQLFLHLNHPQEYMNGDVFIGEKMIQNGICHGKLTFEEVLQKDFPGVKSVDLTQKNRNEKALQLISKVVMKLQLYFDWVNVIKSKQQ